MYIIIALTWFVLGVFLFRFILTLDPEKASHRKRAFILLVISFFAGATLLSLAMKL